MNARVANLKKRRFWAPRGLLHTAIVDDFEIFKSVIEQAVRLALEPQLRQRVRRARELQIGLLQMIQIQMTVSARPYEIADLKVALLRDHVREQRITGDVERHPEQGIGAALVQLAG